MAEANDTLDALNEVHGQEKPADVGIGEWIWGALQGDFNAERSGWQIGFDMVVSLIPVVDTICDLRDLCANIRQYRKDPSNKITLFFIATTAIGFFPEIGTVVKSVLRLVWIYLKPVIKHADDILNLSKLTAAAHRACDAALPKVTEYLQHNRVVQWATHGKLPDMYKFVAKTIQEATEKLSPALLVKLLTEKFNDLKSLLHKIRLIVPSTVREHIDDLLKFVEDKQRVVTGAVQEFVQPARIVLKVVAKRLDDHAWRAQVCQTNRGWIAPISEAGSARLINAKPPKFAQKLSGPIDFPELKMSKTEVQELIKNHPDHPSLNQGLVETFSKNGGIRADTIIGPAKLYRVIDPSNDAAGIFWMTEADFKALKNRDEWRSRCAVKPEWNQNGWFVEFEIKVGETLNIWRGPTASQELKGTGHYLEGGGEQIVFYPGNRDNAVQAMSRVDRKTGNNILDRDGNPDKRVELTDVTGEVVPAKLRAAINDPHIKGPFETGWGATDYTPEEAKRILLTVPGSP